MIPFRFKTDSDKQLASGIHIQFGFYPRNIALYQLAFRHKSVSETLVNNCRVNNERLEYLGDAILSALVAEYLFKKYPTKSEGFLTEARSRIVSRVSLNKLAQDIGLAAFIQYAHGHSVYRSINGNALEAFIGAVFIDRGYDFTRKLIIDKVIKTYVNIDEIVNTDNNFKSRLLEYSQKNKLSVKFNTIGEEGKGYGKLYEIEVVIDGKPYGRAKDYSIKGAEQRAAEQTLKILNTPENNEEQL